MTHTLHRLGSRESLQNDFVVLAMAAQGFNDQGAGAKLASIFEMLMRNKPANAADDTIGGILTGCAQQDIVERMHEKSTVAAVITDSEQLQTTIEEIKRQDLGMSVVVSGDLDRVFSVCKRLGIVPHTVNISLGVMGRRPTPLPAVVENTLSMCGHGMVTRNKFEHLVPRVISNEVNLEDAARKLAATCRCGIFNPKRAAMLMQRYVDELT